MSCLRKNGNTCPDGLALVGAIRDMANAGTPEALARALIDAVAPLSGALQVHCFLRDATGETLYPIAGHPDRLPAHTAIPLDELDNPLVYSLLQRAACLVESLASLVGVGQGFETFCERIGKKQSLLAVPLLDSQANALGVMVITGSLQQLQAWRETPVSRVLVDAHNQLLARLNQQRNVEQNAHYERSVRQAGEAERGRASAAQLLEIGFIGQSAVARKIRRDMLMLAESSLAALLTGETGSGKDHAALLIHQASGRTGKFVPVNCAAIPQELIEAELFGNVRGAFTGATHARNGLVAEANGGTLFLDEIGDMPLLLQGTLLRVLNEKTYRPVGATQELTSNFRLICATHQPLQQLISEGRFREDLYFRICQSTLHLPPLRERQDDIAALAERILLQFNQERHTHASGISTEALARLQAHPFPGNIRELRSLLIAAAERTPHGQHISADTLTHLMSHQPSTSPAAAPSAELEALFRSSNLPETLESIERLLISTRLQQLNGSRTRAAQSLGIPKRTLARKCQKWNLDRDLTE